MKAICKIGGFARLANDVFNRSRRFVKFEGLRDWPRILPIDESDLSNLEFARLAKDFVNR